MTRTLRRRGEAIAGGSLADQLAASVKDLPPPAKTEPAPTMTCPGCVQDTTGVFALPGAHTKGPGCRYEGEPEQKKAPPLFASANMGEGVQPDLQRIIETLYAADAFRDYDDLEKNLEVGEQRGDLGTLREHLDKAEARARRAHKLLLGAKLEVVSWEADQRRVLAAMREKARVELEDEKAEGTRKKVIGKEDVEDRIADLFPDEWKAQQVRRAKMKGVQEDLEHLVKRWDAKCVDLRTLIETLRR